jgi:hypothetical protein
LPTAAAAVSAIGGEIERLHREWAATADAFLLLANAKVFPTNPTDDSVNPRLADPRIGTIKKRLHGTPHQWIDMLDDPAASRL